MSGRAAADMRAGIIIQGTRPCTGPERELDRGDTLHIRTEIKRMMITYLIAGALLSLSSITLAGAIIDSQPVDSAVLQLDYSTINETIARYPFFVLVIHKPLCNPCERMEAAIHELSLELEDQAAFGMINGKNNPLAEKRYNVTGHPTLLVFENGTLVERSEGFASKRYIVERLRLAKPDLNTSQVTYNQ